MFIAALFTMASYGNSQDAPLLMNGSRKCGFIHNGILLSYKENKILSFASKWI
jgi:hypothetical protein